MGHVRVGTDSDLARMQREVREVNEANGWFESDRTVGEGLALLHSEVSEWLEAYRDWGTDDKTGEPKHTTDCALVHTSGFGDVDRSEGCTCAALPKPEGVGSEAADVLIRLLDECERQGIDLGAEFERKIAYNRTREYRHGKKRL